VVPDLPAPMIKKLGSILRLSRLRTVGCRSDTPSPVSVCSFDSLACRPPAAETRGHAWKFCEVRHALHGCERWSHENAATQDRRRSSTRHLASRKGGCSRCAILKRSGYIQRVKDTKLRWGLERAVRERLGIHLRRSNEFGLFDRLIR